MTDVVGLGLSLVGIISKITQHCEQRKDNTQLLQELRSFLQSLQLCIQQTQEKALALRNNSAVWALGSLKADLVGAISDAETILEQGFVRSLWGVNNIRSRIQSLRERIMTSFQTRLSLAALDVAIESKQAQDAYQEGQLQVSKMLQEMFVTTSISLQQEQKQALRKELQEVVQVIAIALESHSQRVETALSTIHSFQPQTSETEEFFEDVLAALDGVSVKHQADAAIGVARRSSSLKWYQDPVTYEIMCDPVKATDGHTYDRWTVYSMDRSPFQPDDSRAFYVAADDVDVRSRLFEKFPEQKYQFLDRRATYRDAALQEAQHGHLADAASRLRHVLEWDPHDVECSKKLKYIQCQMRSTSSKSISSVEVDQSRQIADIQWDTSSSLTKPQLLYPSRLDSARSNRDLLVLSPDGLSCRFHSTVSLDNVGAAIADVGITSEHRDELRGSTSVVFYFEISIEELDEINVVGLGFTGSESFRNNSLPGYYPNSCGYHGDLGYIFADGSRQVQQQQGAAAAAQPVVRQGDTMGAGIHHDHREIFFVYNGRLIAVITNTIVGIAMPIVALGSPGAYVKVAFNGFESCPERRPSRLVISHPDIQRSVVSLSPDGDIAWYIASLRHTLAELPAASLQANYVACFRHPSQIYYFELTVVNEGAHDSNIAIGFAKQNFFQADKLPGWYPNSCAYHGNDGNLYFGRPDIAQNFGPTFSTGDTIGAGIHHASSTIFFTKNGEKVGHTRRLRMSCALYPVVGLIGPDAVVFLNFDLAAPSYADLEEEQPSKLNAPNLSLWMCVSLSPDGLTAHYIASRQSRGEALPAAAFIADRAICTFRRSSQVYYFELTVLNRGESSYITIGFCDQDHFDCLQLPGWYQNSCGYRGDGRLFMEDSEGVEHGPTFFKDDIIGAGVNCSTNTIFFTKNGNLVGDTTKVEKMPYALCPVVGLQSTGEVVYLNFGQAPFSFDIRACLHSIG